MATVLTLDTSLPQSGVYVFMASSTANVKDKCAKLDLVYEEQDIAYLCGSEESCSCHAAVRVAAGERVWLRTVKPDADAVHRYEAGWMTSFSGLLVQPDLWVFQTAFSIFFLP